MAAVRADISLPQARRIALAAQGFNDPRPTGRIDRRHLRRVLDRIGLLQIDSVNVLVRSQELPLFARLGPHPRSLVWDASAAGELFEYWVHEASHVPSAHHHLHRWRMQGEHKWSRYHQLGERRPTFVAEVEQRIREGGPILSADLQQRVGKKGTWWDWDDGKIALEHLFWSGRVTAVRRPSDFARVYDLTERVLPAEVLARPTPSEHDARKELLVLAARHHGLGTMDDLTDYHRQKNAPCKPLLDELVEEGRRGSNGSPSRDGRRRRTCIRRPHAPVESTPGRCSARSTPWCGIATGRFACSGSTTASRSTSPSRNVSTATTSCRSCWVISSWPGWTSRPIANVVS